MSTILQDTAEDSMLAKGTATDDGDDDDQAAHSQTWEKYEKEITIDNCVRKRGWQIEREGGKWIERGRVKFSLQLARGILHRWDEWKEENGNDISRKGGEYESAKWFEVERNRIILTAARPRALWRGILTRPEAGRGNESVTMHCIWNKTCRVAQYKDCVLFHCHQTDTHISNHTKVHLQKKLQKSTKELDIIEKYVWQSSFLHCLREGWKE